MMEDDGKKVEKVEQLKKKGAGDHLGTLVGVQMGPQKINPT